MGKTDGIIPMIVLTTGNARKCTYARAIVDVRTALSTMTIDEIITEMREILLGIAAETKDKRWKEEILKQASKLEGSNG